jgi:tripartite ATP-independent transporter DctP family solute receptor
MMLKKFRCLVLAMALILVFVSCTTFAAKKPIKIVYGHTFPIDHFYTRGDLYFKKLVEKQSKGQIIVDVFPAFQLGSANELIQAVRSGAQQMFLGGMGAIWPKLNTFELPYLYRDDAHLIKVADKINSLIDPKEMAAKTGLRILGVRLSLARHLTSKFPVNSIEDVKGLKIRVPENAMFVGFWKALGAAPTVMPGSDAYTALATGTVDAQENPFTDIIGWKFYEQTKYCAMTGHILSLHFMLINNDFWNGLTARQRKILTDASAKSFAKVQEARSRAEKEAYDYLVKEGMQFTKPDLAPFREKAKAVWGKFGDAELVRKVNALK